VQGGPLSVPTKITRRPDQTPHPPFAGLATEGLHLGLGGLELDRPVEEAVANIMDGFAELHVHPDVPDGLSALAELGIRPVTLSNGSASIAQRLLSSAGLDSHFERFLSVEGA
jgi:2-haloacid dehalogenase